MTRTSSVNTLNLACLYDMSDKESFQEVKITLSLLEREKVIALWHLHGIPAGMSRQEEISRNLERSELVIALLTRRFLADDECMTQAERAIEAGISIFPILVQPCEFERTFFADFQIFPRDKVAIALRPSAASATEAWTEVGRELSAIVTEAIVAPQRVSDRLLKRVEGLGYLHQFTDPPSYFVNRDSIKEQLLQVLTTVGADSMRFANICGSPGMGKSMLADYVGHKLINNYPHAQIKVNLKGSTARPLLPVEIMSEVIRRFDPEVDLSNKLQSVENFYKDILKHISALIVLDDAADIEQVRPCLPPEGCAMIVTSRKKIAIDEAACIPLGPLEEPHAHDMISKLVGHLPPEAVKDICSSSGLIPLKIRLVAGIYAGQAINNPAQ